MKGTMSIVTNLRRRDGGADGDHLGKCQYQWITKRLFSGFFQLK